MRFCPHEGPDKRKRFLREMQFLLSRFFGYFFVGTKKYRRRQACQHSGMPIPKKQAQYDGNIHAYIVEDDEILFALLPFSEFTNLMNSVDSSIEEIEAIERLIG